MAEIIGCPNCQRQLQVPEQFLGQTVQCPECRHEFTAAAGSVRAPSTPAPTGEADPPRARRQKDDDEPYRRRSRYDDDEDDDFDLRRGRGHFTPHRGSMILALGLVSLIGGILFMGLPALLGPVAWVMGSRDLREIRDGHMDPAGESLTRSGQVCGIIATLCLIGCGSCVFLGMFEKLAKF